MVILVIVVDFDRAPVALNFGVSLADHFVFVQAVPVQYRVNKPLNGLAEELAIEIDVLESTVTIDPLIYKLNVGTVINVLNLITILLVIIASSYIAVMLFDVASETKYL
jgi:hypothetical protein